MDLDNLKNQVSNITLYDLKAGFRKAQNAVMNYTEMEAKVREATNNEPWGCSTSDMQTIANGTFNYATLNEIMPMIYKRFTEKSAEEWRQIYKALQLLEFLIKNGSERVIDDARSHLSLLKMLRQFHYIDQNGKDQGMNVRNRAKELAELLADVDRIRSERKKARTSKNKYGGVEGGAGIGGSGHNQRYSGFGSETGGYSGSSYGGYSGGVYGDGGGFSGSGAADYGDSTGGGRRDRFEEYDEYDEGTGSSSAASRRTGASSRTTISTKPEPPKKPKEPEVDLFDFGADDIPPPSGVQQQNVLVGGTTADEDDFDDFQSATPQTTSLSPAMPSATPAAPSNFFDTPISPPPKTGAPTGNYSAFNMQPSMPTQQTAQKPMASPPVQSKPSGYQAATPNYFGSIQSSSGAPVSTPGNVTSPSVSSTAAAKPTATTKTSGGADPFANLAIGGGSKKPTQAQKGPTMADMAKEKASAGIWGTSGQQNQQGGSLF